MSEPELILNGRAQAFPGADLLALLADMNVERNAKGVAVAVNGEIIPRSRWAETRLAPGDEVDVVGAVQGG
ncbi:MAG: sulfur carrier protein ThiS [Gammaproteobacteria bacterium]|nr:MAG: sulfur carrier protein ThiS [Gammaproteobacteria bacterium]